MKNGIFLFTFLISVVAQAKYPTPTIECSYPNGGSSEITVKFQTPLYAEGHKFTKFKVSFPTSTFCPNVSDFDAEMMKSYSVEIAWQEDYRSIQIGNILKCAWVRSQYANFQVPVRIIHGQEFSLTGSTLVEEQTEIVDDNLCEEDR